MSNTSRMEHLVKLLNEASRIYYTSTTDEESALTDAQYDRYLAELLDLEEQLGYQLADSPTRSPGYLEENGKVKHHYPVLSLKDTKSIDELLYFLGEEEGVLSWKLDGVSIVLYYNNGILERAVSRGNGEFGQDITSNVRNIPDVPKRIVNKGIVIIRGEGCVSISNFDEIKATDAGSKYRNARNLAAGLINTKSQSTFMKYMSFIAHSIIHIEGYGSSFEKKSEQLAYLKTQKFNVVPYKIIVNYTLKTEIDNFTKEVEQYNYPVDGLVLTINDILTSAFLGATSRYPRDSLAFKWADTSAFTNVVGMKWSVSKNGLITPVVIFKPVELEGTTIRQANLHSLKIFEDLAIGIGDKIEVYKANMIIPEVKENYTRSSTEKYPLVCPVCGGKTVVVETMHSKKLYCEVEKNDG